MRESSKTFGGKAAFPTEREGGGVPYL